MKKRTSKAVSFCMAAVLAFSNTTPAMAALSTLDYDSAMEGQLGDAVLGDYKRAPSLDELIPTQRNIVRAFALDSSTSSDADLSDSTPSDSELATAANALFKMAPEVMIENEKDLESFFPDENFRAVVFNAVRDGKEGAVGVDIEDALANFKGNISAEKKGIADVSGLQYLRKAESVDLRKNEIKDFTMLANSSDDWYGYQNEDMEWVNVTWNLTGNPFEKLPGNFGGKLVIKQPGTGSYTYDKPMEYTFVRGDKDSCEGTLNIQKCTVYEGDSVRPAKLISAAAIKGAWATPLMKVVKIDDTTAKLSNIVKSGTQMIGIGMEQELHYRTTDEYGTITPGSQSAKYYMNAKVALYDKITVNSHPYKGSVTLVKTSKKDSAKRVPGAVYALYQNGTKLKEYTTDAQGQITVMGLEPGSYYFQEISSPSGYLLNSQVVDFEVVEHKTTISGGRTSVELPGGIIEHAGDNEVFIAGPESYGNSDDIVLTRKVNDSSKVKVTVTYSSLGAAPEYGGVPATSGEKSVKVFYDVKEAEKNINNMKDQNKITGPVTVDVEYINTAIGAIKVSAEDEEDPGIIPKTETTVVSGTKTWVDESGYTGFHPDIIIQLYQNGRAYSSITLHDGQEAFQFHDLPKYDAKNVEYKYTVAESFVDSNEAPNFIKKQEGNNFTNTFSRAVTEIEGLKGWDDSDVDGLKHPTVTIRLKQNGQVYKTCEILPNQNSYSFEDLPIRDAKGNEYVYTVEEVPIEDYESVLQSNGRDFLNTYTPGHEGEEPNGGGNGGGGGGGGRHPGGNNTPPVPNGPGTQPSEPPSEPSGETPPLPSVPETPAGTEEYSELESLPKTGDSRSCLSLLVCVGSSAAVVLLQGRKSRKIKKSIKC